MIAANNIKTFPFTSVHFSKFRKELEDAGGFDKLMLKKKALLRRRKMKQINIYYDIEKYKRKFLIDEYESLREFYDTEMPFVFWNAMYETLLRNQPEKI